MKIVKDKFLKEIEDVIKRGVEDGSADTVGGRVRMICCLAEIRMEAIATTLRCANLMNVREMGEVMESAEAAIASILVEKFPNDEGVR